MLHAAALLFTLTPPAFANTFVIDDNGGPGVDFTDIPSAIAAAAPGDVLLVRASSYAGFTLSKGLSILGESGVIVSGATVSGVPSGQVAVLTDFQTSGSTIVSVSSCTGTVIVQRVTGSRCRFFNTDSSDVRLWGVHGEGYVSPALPPRQQPLYVGAGLIVRRSRVEAVQSTMAGEAGFGDPDFPLPGFPAVVAEDLSLGVRGQLHLALTSATGGKSGGSISAGYGMGGAGVLVGPTLGCDVVIAGGGLAFLRGGAGVMPGSGGTALVVEDPKVRYSGVDLIPGLASGVPGAEISASDPSYVVAPGYADPTLGVSGSTTPGGLLVFQIRGHPRSKAFLNYGHTPIVQSDSFSQIGVLVDTIRGLKLGAIPVSGEIDRAFPIPSNAAVGALFVFQAVVVLPTGEIRRTNSVPVIVR